MSGRSTSRHRRRAQALRRHRAAPLLALAALAGLGASASAKPKPPPKPKPKIELLTRTEQGALRRKAIKVQVTSRRGDQARARGDMVIDGYPEDFFFRLGPKTQKLRRGKATFRFGLSPRKREVLDFAIKSCRGTTLAFSAQVGKGSGTLDTSLALPGDC